MRRLQRVTRLTRPRARPSVRRVPVAERVHNLADPRLWPNAVQIAEGLGRPVSTVRDALANYLKVSRSVGRERRYPWTVTFELARIYAVPIDELTAWAHSFLEGVARERDFDPRDLYELYGTVRAQWEREPREPNVTSEMVRRLTPRTRPHAAVIEAEQRLAEAHETAAIAPTGPRSISREVWEQARSSSP